MGKIVFQQLRDDQIMAEIMLSKDEARELGGEMEHVFVFTEQRASIPTRISLRGKREATKYFLIPKVLRRSLNTLGSVHCQRIQRPDKDIFVYVVNKDSTAKTVTDLNGKKIGVETATTSEDFINRRLEIDAPGLPPIEYKLEPGEVMTYADSMLPFDDLRLGDGVRLDAVIAPEQTAMNAIKNGYPVKTLEGEYAFREPLVVIADKGDAEWTAKVGEIIAAMKADGTLGKMTTEWYGKDYSAD